MFPLDPAGVHAVGKEPGGGEGTADLGVDDPHNKARDEILNSEAENSVDEVVRLIRPVLALQLKDNLLL